MLGYNAGELVSSSAEFWLVDWKGGTHDAYSATAPRGIALSRISGDLSALSTSQRQTQFWGHSGVAEELARGSTLGATGWVKQTLYSFDLVFTASLVEVFVDGVKQISVAGSFSDGGFGFYNFFLQDRVTYAGLQEEVLPPPPPPGGGTAAVPLPATLPLAIGAIGLLGLVRRRRHAARP